MMEKTSVKTSKSIKSNRFSGIKEFAKDNWYLLFALAYLISPLDFLPDDLPLIGNVDDAIVLLIEAVRRYQSNRKALSRSEISSSSDSV